MQDAEGTTPDSSTAKGTKGFHPLHKASAAVLEPLAVGNQDSLILHVASRSC